MHLNFTDTQTAFQHLSEKDLRRAVFLFSLITRSFWVKTGKLFLRIAGFLHIPYGWAVKNNIFRHFCGGETIRQCFPLIHKLKNFSCYSILDYSAEGIDGEANFDNVRDEILGTLAAARENESIAFGVFKFTGMCKYSLLEKASAGVSLSEEESVMFLNARKRAFAVFSEASQIQTPVFVDAEETWIQPEIDTLAIEGMKMFNRSSAVVFTTVQMYRISGLHMVSELISTAKKEGFIAGIKLVRGAYMEKERSRSSAMGYPSPIHPTKDDTDRAFNDAITLCLNNSDHIHVCIATHNEESCYTAASLMKSAGISPENKKVWFAQLYGMSDHITFNLAAKGYNTAKYLPYGPIRKVMPYLIRRAEENSSVSAQSNREILNFRNELNRRRSR
jgi:proline dehydrogenase